MASKKKEKKFSALVRLDMVTDIDIYAETWESALEQAKALSVQDCASLTGSYIDGNGAKLESLSLYESEYGK